MQCCF